MNYLNFGYTGFHKIHPHFPPVKLLTDKEKEEVLKLNINLHTLLENDIIVRELEAKVGDIICVRKLQTDVYRMVISK